MEQPPAKTTPPNAEAFLGLETIGVQPTTHGKVREILDLGRAAQVLGVDEVQFFDATIVEVCEELADAGKRVIVAGLDQDFRGQPFEPMPELLAVAEYITAGSLPINNRAQTLPSAALRLWPCI